MLFKSRAAPNGFVYAQGTKLYLNGGEYKFSGINAYHLTTDYAINYGCGENNTQTDVDTFFASLRPNSMVRVWAWQQLAWDKNTNSLNFTTIDRIINSAATHNQKIIMTLGNQWGTGCGEARKTESWYGSGYKTITHNGNATDVATIKLSYWDYLDRIIPRYANSSAVGMWEPINEPAADDGNNVCSTTAPATLRAFFDSVGGKIHALDPNHLISSGLQGSGQCGTRNAEYQTLHQSPGLDIASYHDYSADQPIPGDQWNGMQVRLNQMAAIGKPLFVGEVGIKARDNVAGCLTTTLRHDKMKAKMDAQYAAGVVGFVPWAWVKPNARIECTSDYGFDIEQGQDALLTLVRTYPLPNGGGMTDSTPPVITITSPVNGSTIGSSAAIKATGSDNVAVTKMEVYIDGNLRATTTNGSINYTWNSRKAARGAHTITVKAYDAAGNVQQASLTVYK